MGIPDLPSDQASSPEAAVAPLTAEQQQQLDATLAWASMLLRSKGAELAIPGVPFLVTDSGRLKSHLRANPDQIAGARRGFPPTDDPTPHTPRL